MTHTILFTGDSVTDCGRREDVDGLGDGYVRLVAASARTGGARILNTGISGNRVRDLRVRWQQDVLDHEPQVVSVLVGINDTWRRYDSGDPTGTAEFEADYRWLLESTVAPGRTIVLMEPFVLPVNTQQASWRTEDLEPKIAVVRALAAEFGAVLVPTDSTLIARAAVEVADTLADDGVHPTPRGHELIAELWLESYAVAAT